MKTMGLILILCLVVLGGLVLFSRKLLYFPAPLGPGRRDHVRSRFPDVEEIRVPAARGAVLHGWLLKKDREALPLVFYFGGNAEEVSLNLEDFQDRLNASVVLVNYRGYGGSTGTPKEDDLKADALAVYDFMAGRLGIDPARAAAWGRSLGSSMACYLALHRGLGRLILTCPFDSIENVAASVYPSWLVRMVLKDRHRTTDFSGQIRSRTLVLAAGRDEVIPGDSTRRLFESLSCEKEFVRIQGAGHNTISGFQDYFRGVNRFLRERQ